METTKKIIRIDGKDIVADEKDVPQAELLFYPENPRIKSVIDAECGDNPTQLEIETKMKSLEHVKELRRSIIANDGLLEPIIVKGNIVLEGNSRLAAYRMLCETDPVKWGKIRATILPEDTSEDAVFSMLGTLHIVGKTPWNPFEQAGYLQRRVTTSRKPIDAIASDLGLSPASAKKYIKTLELMVDNDDAEPTKWSYYFELVKNSSIQKAIENYPQHNVEEIIIEKIKENEFNDARELRKVGKVMSASGETAQEAILGFLNGTISLEESLELVESESKLANLVTKIKTISDAVIKNEEAIRQNSSDTTLRYQLKLLFNTIKNLLGE